MAGARAATSLSLTITVALATLVVMGGILAGPTILDCAKDGGKFGACLRDRIADSGLIAPEGETVEKQILTSETPSAEPEPSIVAETPRPTGWLEANANEYEPGSPAPVALTSAPGELIALGDEEVAAAPEVDVALARPEGTLSAVVPELVTEDIAAAAIVPPAGELLATGEPTAEPTTTVDIALAAPMGELVASGSEALVSDIGSVVVTPPASDLPASGSAVAEPSPAVDVALAAPVGRLSAAGEGEFQPGPTGVSIVAPSGDLVAKAIPSLDIKSASIQVALAGPVGELTASMATLEPVAPPALMLLPRSGAVTVLGTTTGADAASVALEANVSLEPFSLGPPLATGSIDLAVDAPASVSLEASVVPPIEQPIPAPPKPVIEFNPAFPNVLVLPPPNTGENSSFGTLELN